VLALHAARGDAVRVVIATGGAARAAESRAAAAVLGIGDVRALGFDDGRLGAAYDLVGRLKRELADFGPELVYAPSAFEHHPDHQACHKATLAALAGLEPARRRELLCYGVNTGVSTPLPAGPKGVLVDITPWVEKKRAALACFASQPAELADGVAACDRGRTLNVDRPEVRALEGFLRTDPLPAGTSAADALAATAVISNWNKREDLRENLDALRAQTRPFAEIVVVDNASDDGSAAMVAERYPEVRLVVMPHSRFGACETFNIGFKAARTPLVAILDDDVVLPPEWLERAVARLVAEPETTAIVSTEVIEPGMPAGFLDSPAVARERYMSTFRGCGSLARAAALQAAGGYDERLYIYGNERDLTCRLLNLGYRVLHYPAVRAFHKTPFGIKLGRRSLYYHARNAWLSMLKYAPLGDLLCLPWLVVTRVLLRHSSAEAAGQVTDATGTIGIARAVREHPGAWWVLLKAAGSVLWNVPYCLRRRQPVRAPDFELPLS
jgi:GT2 family glycosyltransferase/LmbE family N-acetylglucosaminyl deacetylase